MRMTNVADLIMDGIQQAVDAKERETAEHHGVFRGGSTGVIYSDGAAGGKCVREAAARFLGAEPERDPAVWLHKQLMFEAGFASEDSVFENLRRVWPGVIKREEEFPIEWTVDGVRGTGREDLILCDAAGSPQLLVELKAVCSLSSVQSALLQQKPKAEHAIQLANYMLRSGLPGQLLYVSRVDFPVPDWGYLKPDLPRGPDDTAHPAAPYCVWSRGGRGKPPQVTKITQFIVAFEFRWVGAEGTRRLEWRSAASDVGTSWNPTDITAAGLDEFCRRVTALVQRDVDALPEPHSTRGIEGGRDHFSSCNYCEWAPICRDAEQQADPVEAWHAAVTRRRDEALGSG